MWKMAQDFWTILSHRQRLTCCFSIVAMALAGLLEAVGIGAILPLISFLDNPAYVQRYPWAEQAFAAIGANTFFEQITVFCLGLMAFYLIKGFLVVYINKKQYAFVVATQKQYGAWLLSYYLHKSYLFHVNTNSASLISNMESGLTIIFRSLLIEYFHLGAELLTACMIWLLLVYLDWFTAIIVAGFFSLLLYLLLRAIRRKSMQAGEARRSAAQEGLQWLKQGLAGIKETKIGSKEDFFVQAYTKAYAKNAESEILRLLLSNMPRTVIELVVVIALVLLTWIKLWLGESGAEIVPLLGVLALAAFRLMPCANRSMISFNSIKYGQPTFCELYSDLVAAKELALKTTLNCKNEELPFEHQITLQNLAFGYEADKMLWQKVNLKIKKGDYVGVIGASGAGKTTFLDVLLGLLEPTAGSILVDGQDIATKLTAWQAKMGYVAQNIYMIDGTICENVAFGEAPDKIRKDRVWQALQMAELADVVCQLSNGLDSEIGESGLKLSGGQRQRLGIARALYKQPEILVLDEATSSLDTTTEKAIVDTLLKLRGKITIISVAHRASTLENCDYKFCVAQGAIAKIKE